jgi:hypothetical protein
MQIVSENLTVSQPVARASFTSGLFGVTWRVVWESSLKRGDFNRYGCQDAPHFHDIRAKNISDNASFDAAYLLAGHISPSMTRKTYDRNRRRVEPLR